MSLLEQPAWTLRDRLLAGEIRATELTQAIWERIDAREAQLGAYLTLREREVVLEEAAAIDRRLAAGEPVGPLAGLPVSLKDNLSTAGLRTTCASRMLESYVPPYDATVVERLRAADALLIGKTNLDEFAMGASTERSALGRTTHPHDPSRVPGGSSGGAAASVAAAEALLALGSDTGGSIRQPASFCGVVGMKPTYGRVSRYGLVAYASSFDQIGPLATDVRSASLLLSVISGHDPMDSTSAPRPALPEVREPAEPPLRIGVPVEYFREPLAREVQERVERAIALLEAAGHERVEVSIPTTRQAIAAYYLIVCAEASSNLARFDGVRYGFRAEGCKTAREMICQTRSQGFGDEVKRRIVLGTYVLSAGYYDAFYAKACRARTLLARELAAAFEHCDVLAFPVAPTVAYELGASEQDFMMQYLGDVYTVLANLTGSPALSLPCGATEAGLPVGLQLAAPPFEDERLLAAALEAERLLAEAAG